MTKNKCVTYHSNKTKSMALGTVSNYCNSILSGDSATISVLQRLCGAVVYSSLFLIPDYNLVDGRQYTIENICYNVTGLLAIPMHEVLSLLGDICFEETDIESCLKEILGNSMFAEAVSLTGVNTKELYCALLRMYSKLSEIEFPMLPMLLNNSFLGIVDVQGYFNKVTAGSEIGYVLD